jgi:hypothetical protein
MHAIACRLQAERHYSFHVFHVSFSAAGYYGDLLIPYWQRKLSPKK